MKKPLLYSLLVWLVLFILPTTRPQAVLDWKSATLQPFEGLNPAWAPRDKPYLPENSIFSYPVTTPTPNTSPSENVQANGLLVALPFASLTNTSKDRDVLVWCARSGRTKKDIATNMTMLATRFPADAELLAWACSSQVEGLSSQTYQVGTSFSMFVSRSAPTSGPGTPEYAVAQYQSTVWNALAVDARRGQKLEPSNGFWWWLEASALMGARRDQQAWPVLRAGSTKPTYDDHMRALTFALRHAHLATDGIVPIAFYLDSAIDSTTFSTCWQQAAQQMYKSIISQLSQGQKQKALLGARDLMLMGKMLRLCNARAPKMAGIDIEFMLFRVVQVAFVARSPGLPAKTFAFSSASSTLQGISGSLWRYALDHNQKDITHQMTIEWNNVNIAKLHQRGATRSLVMRRNGWITGVDNSVLALAGGFQNNGTLLLQTLPIPLLLLCLLSLGMAWGRHRDEPFALPIWKHGLGWSAFSLVALLAAQLVFNHLLWDYVVPYMTAPYGLDFLLPRLAYQLPLWAFTFSACVLGIGALWSLMFAARRALGEKSILERFNLLYSAPDDRAGVVNLEPVMQVIGIAGAWGALCIALALWFFLPARDALRYRSEPSAHEAYSGLSLSLFCLATSVPAIFYRTKRTGFRLYSLAYLHLFRRFLVAHIALVTTLYLLFAYGAAYWGSCFDAQWLQANPLPLSSG